MMKICFITGAFYPMKCGVGDYTKLLAEELAEFGHEVFIITSKQAKNISKKNLKIFNVVEKWDFDFKEPILSIIKNIKPDIVHIQYPSNEYGKSFLINLLPKFIKSECDAKVIETVHEYLHYTAKGKLRNLINYFYSDEIIIVEKQYKEMIKSFLPIISKKLNINYIPIASNIPKSTLSKEEIERLKLKLNLNNYKIITHFGFVNELKGVEKLLDCAFQIKKRIKYKILILSELNGSNEYHCKILKLIKKLNLEDYVIITGFMSAKHVADYLKMSDIAVLPFVNGVSERNGSFLAAYNQGIPILTTSNNKTLIENGVFYTKYGDVEAMVKTLSDILSDDSKIYKRNIEDWIKIAQDHLNIYIK